jgi:pseudaminic acid biosynthesis-associated methylase
MKTMISNFKTEQESFWAGEFGDEYTSRNDDSQRLASNVSFFSKVFNQVDRLQTAIEFGANIGLNLRAIKQLIPNIELTAVEINATAAEQLKLLKNVDVFNQSFLEFTPTQSYDFVLAKGVLIHVNPDALQQIYELMYESSHKYICIAEYYNPSPVAIPYRGHQDKLFKRDFAGEMLDKYSDLKLVDYGFVYHRDKFSQDDLTWFLLKKS